MISEHYFSAYLFVVAQAAITNCAVLKCVVLVISLLVRLLANTE